MDAVMALVSATYAAQQRSDMDEVTRMASRLFRELSANDRKYAMRIMTDSWLRELKGPAQSCEKLASGLREA